MKLKHLSWIALAILLSLLYFAVELPLLDRLPIILTDESWYANTAYNWIQGHGLVNTNTGWRGGDQLFLWTMFSGAFFKFFGTSLYIGRLASVFLGLLSLWGFIVCLKKMTVTKRVVALTSSLWIFSNVFYILFRRLRPESLLIALSIWGLYFLIAHWQNKQKKPLFFASLLIGLSLLAHPNGIIMILVVGLMVLIEKDRWKNILVYSSGLLLMAVFFVVGWQLLKDVSFLSFVQEMLHNKRTSVSGNPLITFYTNIMSVFPGYTLGLKRAYMLFAELGILVYGILYYKHKPLTAKLSLLGLLYFFAAFLILNPFFRAGFGVILIFSFLAFATLFDTLYKPLIILYFANTLAGDIFLVKKDYRNTSFETLSHTLAAIVPKNSIVLTHIQFWFPLKDSQNYNSNTNWSITPYKDLIDCAQTSHIDYAVITDEFAKEISPTTGKKQDLYAGGFGDYYEKAQKIAKKGTLIKSIPTQGYGVIQVWKL